MSGQNPNEARLAELASRYRRADRWAPVEPDLDARIAADVELERAARTVRIEALERIQRLPLPIPIELIQRFSYAFVDVRRERFVLPDDIALSARDEPMPLDAHGHATVSAPHAYLLTDALLALGPGDRLLELGTGTGYGAAIARRLVGRAGHVSSIEVDAALAARAARLLEAKEPRDAEVALFDADAADTGLEILRRERPNKVAFTYAVADAPRAFLDALPEGGVLVAPVGPPGNQELCSFTKEAGAVVTTSHGAVRYVTERRR